MDHLWPLQRLRPGNARQATVHGYTRVMQHNSVTLGTAMPAASAVCSGKRQVRVYHHGGQQAGFRSNWLCAGVQQHKAACAIGVLGLQRPAALPEHCRLLVSQAAYPASNPLSTHIPGAISTFTCLSRPA